MAELVPLDVQQATVLAEATPLSAVEVPTVVAQSLVLADDVVAPWPLPTFDNSAMDGYAVRREDVETASGDAPVRLRVVADVPAGSPLDPPLRAGECARIMTGAPVPSDADAIVPFEATSLGTAVEAAPPDTVEVLTVPTPGAHIRRIGEDAQGGEVIVPRGDTLAARGVAAAVAAGVATVRVIPRPRLAVITTGDELTDPGVRPERGSLPDSNGPLVAGLAREAGAEVTRLLRTGDGEGEFLAAMEALAGEADVIVTTGGVSVGAFDVVRLALAERGIAFTKVAMQPGKPQGFGRFGEGGPLVFCLPGNPVSVFASFEAFVRPALRRLAGIEGGPVTEHAGVAAEGWTCPVGRAQLMPVRTLWTTADGRPNVVPAARGGSGSHLAASLARADGLALVPADVSEVRAGDALVIWEVLA